MAGKDKKRRAGGIDNLSKKKISDKLKTKVNSKSDLMLQQFLPGQNARTESQLEEFLVKISENQELKNTLKYLVDKYPKAAEAWTGIISLVPESNYNTLAEYFKMINETIDLGHNPGKLKKHRTEQFAIEMGQHLDRVRSEGHTTVRDIADRFNQLGIATFHNKKWNHDAVHRVIVRRRKMGLE